MRRIRHLVGLLVLTGAVVAGCESSRDHLRPPKPPEEFNAPPPTDPRYSGPVEYPRDVMDQDPLLKRATKDSKTPGMMNNRMGGPGATGGRIGGP